MKSQDANKLMVAVNSKEAVKKIRNLENLIDNIDTDDLKNEYEKKILKKVKDSDIMKNIIMGKGCAYVIIY